MITLLTYSDENYLNEQERLKKLSINLFDNIIEKNRLDLIKTDFYIKNKKILDQKRGGGFWLWKPFFIYEELKKLKNDDIIIYIDCGDVFVDGFYQYINEHFKNNDFLLIEGYFKNYQYTKKDCFVMMKCDSDYYWSSSQLEAGVCGFKKTEKTMKFLEEWLYFCLNENILTDLPNICGLKNLNGFIDHRHDQSILTNLCLKYNINQVSEIKRYIYYNKTI